MVTPLRTLDCDRLLLSALVASRRAARDAVIRLLSSPRRSSQDMVAEACWANGLALQYAPAEMRGDPEAGACRVMTRGADRGWR